MRDPVRHSFAAFAEAISQGGAQNVRLRNFFRFDCCVIYPLDHCGNCICRRLLNKRNLHEGGTARLCLAVFF
ncbi:Putative spore and germination protein [Bacillus subtilis QB928]|nr:Putative spore and germination protein [Bacillus subtilis QB928]